MSRFQVLSDEQSSLIPDLLPARTGRPVADARLVVAANIDRHRCGIAWRDLPEVFGPWQTVWTWHRRMAADGTWERAVDVLTQAADQAGLADWSLYVDSSIARAHQHATNSTRHTGAGSNHHPGRARAIASTSGNPSGKAATGG